MHRRAPTCSRARLSWVREPAPSLRRRGGRRLRRHRRRRDPPPRRLSRRHRVRARRAHRRRLAPQHLSRRRVRRPVAPLRVLLRAEPALVAALRSAVRDPGLPRGRRPRSRRARPHPHGHRGASRALGRGALGLETSAGTHEADVLLTACGQLSVPNVPPIPGLDSFDGPAFHTASGATTSTSRAGASRWSGTGCSAIQVVPAIQPVVEHVDVYQRSPGWTIPKMDFAYGERAPAAVRALRRAPARRPRGGLRLPRARRGRR